MLAYLGGCVVIETIVLAALQIVIGAAPGFLAALTGHVSDADALDHAQRAIDRIPSHPAGSAIADWRRHLDQTRVRPVIRPQGLAPLAAAVVEHVERETRSEDITTEIKVGAGP